MGAGSGEDNKSRPDRLVLSKPASRALLPGVLLCSLPPSFPPPRGCWLCKHTIGLFPLPLSIIFCWMVLFLWTRCLFEALQNSFLGRNSFSLSGSRWKVGWGWEMDGGLASFRTTAQTIATYDNRSKRQKGMFAISIRLAT